MNTPRSWAAWSLLVALLCAIAPAQAAGAIHRCQTSDGMSVYTDAACASLDARPAPMSAELVSRLAMDPMTPSMDSTSLRNRIAPMRRAPQYGCARNPRQLTMDLLGSFAMGDINRIAESVHWPGLRHRQAHEVMRRLQQLARQSLVDASFWPGSLAGTDGGAMQLTFAQPQRVLELGVERYAGCYFVRF